jgi:hypothetical protein
MLATSQQDEAGEEHNQPEDCVWPHDALLISYSTEDVPPGRPARSGRWAANSKVLLYTLQQICDLSIKKVGPERIIEYNLYIFFNIYYNDHA